MSVYNITLKPLSVITNIPNSQTIFGAFCYTYKYIYGEEKLKQLLEKEYDSPFFAISSMYYKNTVSVPMDFNPSTSKDITLKDNLLFKKIKKIKYFTLNTFNEYKKNKEIFEENFYSNINSGKLIIVNKEILAFNNEDILKEKYYVTDTRVRNSTIDPLDKKLFRDEVMYLNEKLEFSIYLSIDDVSFEDEILFTFKSMEYVSLGGYKSIGYNLFSVIGQNKLEIDETYGLLLSKVLVTKDIDFDKSNYLVQTIRNVRLDSNEKKYQKTVYAINEGATLKTNKLYPGGLIKDESGIYQNYIGMLL